MVPLPTGHPLDGYAQIILVVVRVAQAPYVAIHVLGRVVVLPKTAACLKPGTPLVSFGSRQ